ncbi:MAG: zinc ribbon domain-containing protein [Candidatus Nitrosocaldus sp.]|nr:zinc ribbon domain-containing protein [Candidatus Nitrosocaldus sp.]MDW8000490.1 hypothetical protein [Candidatus Nitrosocaldus sp.]
MGFNKHGTNTGYAFYPAQRLYTVVGMIGKGNGHGRWWKDSDSLQAMARFLLLVMMGMFTAYTLVNLFGLLMGGLLAFGVVWYFQRVMNSLVGGEGTSTSRGVGMHSLLPSRGKVALRYRCLHCHHVYTARRECPVCGSVMKQLEF